MGKCIHCGRPAGLFSDIHPGCYEEWQAGLHSNQDSRLEAAGLATRPNTSRRMVLVGTILIFIGLFAIGYALLVAITVPLDSGDRVGNVVQIATRFTYLVVGGFAAVIGSVFIAAGHIRRY